MADNRTMAQLLEAPTEGYEDAIVIPEITANNFEIKHGLLNLVQNKQFFGNDKEDPHAHIRYFQQDHFYNEVFRMYQYVRLNLFFSLFSRRGSPEMAVTKNPLGRLNHGSILFRNSLTNSSLPLKRQISEMKSRDFNKNLMRHFMRLGIVSMIFYGDALIMGFP
ncbi:hypothetical protein Tco_0655272 [Tanacetum coccineum]|uniref:Reverse transcriptase domain-containing protein n=1 Tax=Tanacetum coccineum TaxID=301880 RepID=A0ABQ4X637_9ASTR